MWEARGPRGIAIGTQMNMYLGWWLNFKTIGRGIYVYNYVYVYIYIYINLYTYISILYRIIYTYVIIHR